MAFPETWHVRTRSRKCHVTEKAFVDEQAIITALYPDTESSGYVRRDFCEAAWSDLSEENQAFFSHWKTIFHPTPIDHKPQPVTKQSAEELLRTLVEDDEPHTENTRYILAVMLERQKLLRETDSQPVSEGTIRIYEHRKTGEVYIVKDPNIPLSQVEEIQEEVIQMLSPKPVEEIAELETPAADETQEDSPEQAPATATEEKTSQ